MTDQNDVPTKEEFSELLAQTRFAPGRDVSELFHRTRDQLYPEKTETAEPEVVLFVTVEHGKKPIPYARIDWHAPDGEPVAGDGRTTTDKQGVAYTAFRLGAVRGLSHLSLTIELPERDQTISMQVPLGVSGTHRRAVEAGLVVSVGPPVTPAERVREEPAVRRTRVPVAISARPEHLARILPYVRAQQCLTVRSVFLEKSKQRRPRFDLPKSIKLFPLDRGIEDSLENVRYLIDFSGSSTVRAIHKKKATGKAAGGPFVLLGGEAFLDHLEILFNRIDTSLGARNQ